MTHNCNHITVCLAPVQFEGGGGGRCGVGRTLCTDHMATEACNSPLISAFEVFRHVQYLIPLSGTTYYSVSLDKTMVSPSIFTEV